MNTPFISIRTDIYWKKNYWIRTSLKPFHLSTFFYKLKMCIIRIPNDQMHSDEQHLADEKEEVPFDNKRPPGEKGWLHAIAVYKHTVLKEVHWLKRSPWAAWVSSSMTKKWLRLTWSSLSFIIKKGFKERGWLSPQSKLRAVWRLKPPFLLNYRNHK